MAVAADRARVAAATDLALVTDLDAVVALSPADTCLVVAIDGRPVYDHRGGDLQVPASTQKVLTAAASLERLGRDHRFRTSLVTSAAVRDGVVEGDVTLVGGGDPTLITSVYRVLRPVGADEPVTLLDDLGTSLRAEGITRIDGRILGDESLFDDQRTVASWPARYIAQGQSGPLTALTVDDATRFELGEQGLTRVRSTDPPADAARALAAVLSSQGIEVTGGAAAGTAPPGARPLVAARSKPMSAVTADILARSDNQGAELLLKHLGVEATGVGSTAAGATALADWSAEAGVAPEGSYVVDGSGLDAGNRVTCQQLVDVLERSGRDSPLAAGLPVAGETGTLARRFRDTAGAGRLRAKTGRLNDVTALAGFVDGSDGTTATFAYIANGTPVTAEVLRAQDFLAEILGRWVPPCPDEPGPDLLVPLASQVTALSTVAGVGGGFAPMAAATAASSLAATERGAERWLDRCSRAEGIGVTLVP
jgi:D-alanyl-D-alanine carboxypeptidase/D-alanyl-D-alanine-endopeptidase (penicillin-binding protein 4)